MITLSVSDEYNQTSSTTLHVAVVQGADGATYTQLQGLVQSLNAEAITNAQTITTLTQKNASLTALLQSLVAALNQIQAAATGIIDISQQQKQAINSSSN